MSGVERLSVPHDEMEKYMLEMIKERSGSAALEGRRDLLTNLIDASMEKSDSQKDVEFTDRDLLGNIFIFLFAGYETTASALSFAVALLATHQEEQEELYKHVRSVVPDGRLPTYHDVPRLTRVLAVINETLRLYSPVIQVVKKNSRGLCDPNRFRETSPSSQGDTVGAHDQCHTP